MGFWVSHGLLGVADRLKGDLSAARRRYIEVLVRSHEGGRHLGTTLALQGLDHGSGLGRYRWVVERTFARLHTFNCSSATNAAPTCTTHCSRSAAASWLSSTRELNLK
jgi:hypothetical protein